MQPYNADEFIPMEELKGRIREARAMKQRLRLDLMRETNRIDKEELELMASTSYASWESIKPHVYNVIRGKKLPLSFKIVLVLSQPDIMDMLEKNHLTIPVSDVANLTLNVYYDGMSIQLTSMATQNIFTMDKTLEHVWDAEIKDFLKTAGIYFTES